MEKKFLRMLVEMDAPVLDENVDNGRGGDDGGGNGNGTNFILFPLIKDLPSSYIEWLPPGGRERGQGQ